MYVPLPLSVILSAHNSIYCLSEEVFTEAVILVLQGTDRTMLNKVNRTHGGHKDYIKPKSDQENSFGLNHFAGIVEYDIYGRSSYVCSTAGFLEKNRDSFSADLRQLIHISGNSFLKGLFADDLSERSQDSKKKGLTLSSQFRKSLDTLMKTLASCHPFFIRCIKPNHHKKPQMFDRNLCCRQLRYSGMMETAKIRRAGYPIRHNFKEFVDRYRMLVPGIPPAHKTNCLGVYLSVGLIVTPNIPLVSCRQTARLPRGVSGYRLPRGVSGCRTHCNTKRPIVVFQTDCKAASGCICMAVLGKSQEEHQLGQTKVFLKDAHDTILEQERERVLSKSILILQRSIRAWVYRRRYRPVTAVFLKLREAAIVFQKHWRGRAPRLRYLVMKRGYSRLQALIRSRRLKSDFVRTRSSIVALQLKKRRLQELLLLKKQEEAQMKKSGTKNYKLLAEDNYKQRLMDLQKEVNNTELGAGVESLDDDDYERLVDDLFGDIGDKSSPSIPNSPIKKTTNVFGLSCEVIVVCCAPQDLGAARQDTEEVIDIPHSPVIEHKIDLSEFNFRKFAMTYFRGNINYQYSKRMVKHSLLELPHPGDQGASLALWMTILRFMGDLPEPRYETDTVDNTPVMEQVNQTLSRNILNNKSFQKHYSQQMISMTLKRQNHFNDTVHRSLTNEDYGSNSYQTWLESRRTTNLEKLHFIIGHGILRQELRDEIYCQICKQLTNNPTKASFARGWILLSLCVGCFAPSDKFVEYLRAFIREGPRGYAPYCEQRLDRTFHNGTRKQPPSWVELQTTKSKAPIVIPVVFMDGSVKKLTADSATTAQELSEQLCANIHLKDKYGFSLFIALFDKVSSLGNGSEHVMDAISQCEQYAKEQGAQERNAPWKVYFRKEVFTPWHDPTEDPVATNLIYHQVVRGVKCGEYRCDKGLIMTLCCQESDIAMLAAQQFYVEYKTTFDSTLISNVLPNYIPDQFLKSGGDKSIGRWEKLVVEAYKKVCKRPAVESCSRGVLETCYGELFYRSAQAHTHSFTMETVQGHQFVFQCMSAEEFVTLMTYMQGGLRRRSQYLVATQNYSPPGDGLTLLSLQRGDLIMLEPGTTGAVVLDTNWCVGTCQRNGQKGHFPVESVYVLPTLDRPLDSLLDHFKSEGLFDKNKSKQQSTLSAPRRKLHTLEKYAAQNFRSNQRLSVSRGHTLTSARRTSASELWKHTREPLRQPLLQKLLIHQELAEDACHAFSAILKYMGDLPTRRSRGGVEYTDIIFRVALKNDMLRDEIYCQIMKQLTDNRNRLSEERGWELMWLATGLFACSQNLLKELTLFMTMRSHTVSRYSLDRLQRTLRNGQRKYPPHQVEVEAIQHHTKHIYHKVYFPDDTDENQNPFIDRSPTYKCNLKLVCAVHFVQAFEVNSSTRARDLSHDITDRLNLHSGEGLTLFIKILDKIFSVPEAEFFFDYVRELSEWIKRTRPSRGGEEQVHGLAVGAEFQYQVFFMKKLWVNAVPGRDKRADTIFHFPQELPKYLRGYHKVSKSDAIRLAALIYRTKFGNSKDELSLVSHMLAELVPVNLVKIQSPKDWSKSISSAFQQTAGLSPDDAKIAFLKHTHTWPTFGSTFFEVKQTTEPAYPEMIIVAINIKGINVIHPSTKEVLAVHPFTHISNWSSGNTYFNIQIGNLVRGSKLLCETSLGYKMDDLLTSYIFLLQSSIGKRSVRL
uniref:Myosin-VIIa n=1 Tax=Timema monikensis TaxID=170555 RepID=A0A7R9E9D2_9NEOP|nr:unnamed protein product [Timema monikensis]